jgi:hypothetical protein
MSCALPYATRANLNPNGLHEVAVPRIGSEMPAPAPVEFVIFPRGTINFESEWQSIDLSMTTPLGFLALSKSLSKETGWMSVALPVIASRPVVQSATVHSNGHERFRTLPNEIEANVERIAFNKPVLAPVAFVRFCMRNGGYGPGQFAINLLSAD